MKTVIVLKPHAQATGLKLRLRNEVYELPDIEADHLIESKLVRDLANVRKYETKEEVCH